MLFVATIILIALQQPQDITRPRDSDPFWWIGLLTSPGGLIIGGAFAALIMLVILSISREREKERQARERERREEETANGGWEARL
jgi:hypothetical protein